MAADCEQVLALRQDQDLLVVVAACETSQPDALRSPQEALTRHGTTSWWRVRAGLEVGVVAVPASGPGEALEALRSCTAGRVVVSPVVAGTAGLAEAVRLGEMALATLPRNHVGLVRLAERLPEALLMAAPELTGLLVQEVLGPVLALRPPDRDDLLATLEQVLRHGGSPTHAAASLFCHRNTVINRLLRLERLTGRSLGEPRERLLLELAVLAARLPAEREPAGLSPPARSGGRASR